MVKLTANITKPLPNFHEGLSGTISKVEVIKTQLRGYEGVRVVLSNTNCEECGKMQNLDTNEHADMLWLRDNVGQKSKLGAFIIALGDDTDNWVGKKIVIKTWQSKVRAIQVLDSKKK
jgi:hypothetical protein